ncbi:NDP-hexose 2,3-dehydratase family protein [Eubacterium limosum]|uniref:NDP-hexose 2,3-dehydratase family protein n=1 Tax=Eubacterium limosum TaxID=1736 RepID=A0ABT5UMC2_EUBLI|nr:NDP-hexose 2,3-dehydratase family protein [Eubacterium limosum]MCB6568175.1 NDP-hexose 2,3-dehydratase family protein [Eubacterium limosum]MDE1470038.1 NDP-hexose 2,3-dehydratase family protein [Eubacterium limosum]
MKIEQKIVESWANIEGNVCTMAELLNWIYELKQKTYVNVNECSINDSTFWFYDDYNGEILNRKRSFFSIKGMRRFEDGHFIDEQPIIIQPEIGYLGIICKEIDGVLNFLMQAKIEPGNVNHVQISPTIQATKSNFTRAHGGKLPNYFKYFEESSNYDVIFDQIQSEQATRFYKKRNRNMIMKIDEDIDVYPNFKWMTLGQIKKLMEIDNLVNMDTRTVLSGIPLITSRWTDQELERIKKIFIDDAFFKSIFETSPSDTLPLIFQKVNNYKMFKELTVTKIPLNQLVNWDIDEYGIVCKNQADFMVRYYDIEISGREVQHWTQPLFKAIGIATFGLIIKEINGIKKFLVKIKPEIGSFDKVEVGPSIQWEPTHYTYNDDLVEKVFRSHIEKKNKIIYNVILSEEGGRFFHEQNQNVIIEIDNEELVELPEDYLWVDYSALNYLVQINNCLNIQLRNLLTLLKI